MDSKLKSELTSVLERFREGYIKRDLSSIDAFMDALFEKNDDIVIIGTGNGEWCLGYEEAKEIFLSDWEYWGDLRIVIDNALMDSDGDTAWILTEASLSHTFKSGDETYSRYLGFVKSFFDETPSGKAVSSKAKLSEISYMLCHLLHPREGKERTYQMPLRVSFVLTKSSGRWVIRQMQFSMVSAADYPDVRIDKFTENKEPYESEVGRIKEYSAQHICPDSEGIKSMLKEFQKSYLDLNKSIDEIIEEYFSEERPVAVDTGVLTCTNVDSIKELVSVHRKTWDEIQINIDESIAGSNSNVAWIAADGIVRKNISGQIAFDNAAEKVKGYFDAGMSDKDKLFSIRRTIAWALKESARGEEYLWPFRLEGVLSRVNGRWVFKYMQFSYPFNYILEGKDDIMALIK